MYHQTCDVKTMCYIGFISHTLHWHYIKTALQEYVIMFVISFVIARDPADPNLIRDP